MRVLLLTLTCLLLETPEFNRMCTSIRNRCIVTQYTSNPNKRCGNRRLEVKRVEQRIVCALPSLNDIPFELVVTDKARKSEMCDSSCHCRCRCHCYLSFSATANATSITTSIAIRIATAAASQVKLDPSSWPLASSGPVSTVILAHASIQHIFASV